MNESEYGDQRVYPDLPPEDARGGVLPAVRKGQERLPLRGAHRQPPESHRGEGQRE